MALIEGCKHELEITIPIEEVDKEMEKAALAIQKRANLPGFRPGKAPLSMIRKQFASAIRQETLDHLLGHFFKKRATEDHLKIVGTPDVTDIKWEDGQPLVFTAQFEVAPEIELKEYTGVVVEYAAPSISDEEVAARIEEVRQQKAEYINQDPRPVESTDVALIDLISLSGVTGPPLTAQGMQVDLESAETMPAFKEHIVGMEPGDEKEIEVEYPEDYGQERLAGQKVLFKVTLRMIQKKELPELNDEFAQDLGDFKTFDELKDTVRSNILREKESSAQREAKDAIVQKVVANHDFPIPETYIDRQIEIYVDRFKMEQRQQGRDPEKLNIDMAKVKEAMRPRAIGEVKASLLLDRIAEKESIATMQDEMDREIQRYAKQEREPAAAVRKKWQEDGTLGRIANAIRTEKTLNFLFDNARKEVPKPEAEA